MGGTDGDEKSRTPVIMQSGYFCAISANFANIEGGCCPSASSVTACVNPRSAAAEEGVIRLLYKDPAYFRGLELGEEDFSSKELWRIYSALKRHIENGGVTSPAALSGELSAEEFSLFTGVIQKPEAAANGQRALADYIAVMRSRREKEGSLLEIQGRMQKTKGYGG